MSLDEAWRSGRLREVVGRLAGSLAAEPGDPDRERPVRERGVPDRAHGDADPVLAHGALSMLSIALPMEVPLINSVAAGYPTEFTDLGYPARVADEYIRCPEIKDPDAFAARVVGDSMEPLYREGDIVVFSPARAVKSGMDCFVRLEPDQETTFKRVLLEGTEAQRHRGTEGGEEAEFIRLVPLNGEYEERVVAREMVAGLYAAVSVTRAV